MLAGKFRFGYFELDDIKQQARMFALEALGRYNPNVKHTLDNFLYTHVRNRLINFKRDNYIRDKLPCLACPFFDPNLTKSTNQCAAFADKLECDKFASWDKRAASRSHLVNGLPTPENYDLGEEKQETNELGAFLDKTLPADMRQDYLRLTQGISIPTERKKLIQEKIRTLLENTPYATIL